MSAWVRVEGEHPRWELPGERDGLGILLTPGRVISDMAIWTFGRDHLEPMLVGLPPLPEEAWTVGKPTT